MNNPKAKELIEKLVADIEAGAEIDVLCDQITAIREIALEVEDPLVVKTLRLIREKLQEDDSLDFEIEIEIPEEEEEEYEEPENHLTHLLNLISDSDNKYNREEVKWYRTALLEELY